MDDSTQDAELVRDFQVRMLRALCAGCSTPIYRWERYRQVWVGTESLGAFHETCPGRQDA